MLLCTYNTPCTHLRFPAFFAQSVSFFFFLKNHFQYTWPTLGSSFTQDEFFKYIAWNITGFFSKTTDFLTGFEFSQFKLFFSLLFLLLRFRDFGRQRPVLRLGRRTSRRTRCPTSRGTVAWNGLLLKLLRRVENLVAEGLQWFPAPALDFPLKKQRSIFYRKTYRKLWVKTFF